MKVKNKIHQYDRCDVNLHEQRCRYQGFFRIDEYVLSHQLFNGGESKVLSREIFERGDAVAVIPFDPKNNSIVVVEQFRAGVLRSAENPWLIEFIAGMFGQDEAPEQVAVREAKEEANLNLSPEQLIHLTSYFSSPGGTSEQIHLFAAPIDSENLGGVYGLDDEGEDIKVHVLTLADALALVNDGTINNAMTIIGIQWLALNAQQLVNHWNINDLN
ncbi:NUDIX domain-containing protein [Thalassotalea euphylliae]|uniref:NUDIX domain-containing protein n=1 Tax=Thalassotalea euphylliae TaxID=1655234 RepID=UPI001C6F4A48|nr:NUDIX domain-containing protein [Thalassotalea euphylliae]